MTQENKDLLVSLLAEYKQYDISNQIDYDKFYLYSIITHSTAIEGSTVTELEAQLLFDEGITSSNRTMYEQMMNLDLKNAYDYGMSWILKHEDITVEWLINLSAKVMARTGSEYHSMAGDFSAAKGELRKLNVSEGVNGSSYMSYLKVPQKLFEFCQELNKRRKWLDCDNIAAVYDLSFWAHYELVTIHPWADENGRTGRLLMNLLQMEFGVLPTKVLREEKLDYIQALVDTREEENVNIFLNFMTTLHINHLKLDIENYLKSVHEDVQKDVQKKLSDRQLIILNLIRMKNNITLAGISEELGVSIKTVQRELKELREKGIVERQGGRTYGTWVITE